MTPPTDPPPLPDPRSSPPGSPQESSTSPVQGSPSPRHAEPAVSLPDALPNVMPDVMPGVTVPGVDYTDAGVPTLDYLRNRIEGRHATALGGTELAAESAEGQARQRTEEERERAAAAALARIRASIRPGDGRP